MILDISEYKNSIYHNPQRYDDQYWWKRNDIEFWKRIYQRCNGSEILELGCGTGRLAIPLLKEGANYTGLEISEKFCIYTEKKIIENNFVPNIMNNDFRNFNINKQYDMIFIGFNTFLHLLTDSDVMHFFKSVKEHMHSDTLFYIDIFIPDPLFLYKGEKRIKNLEYVDSETNETMYVDEVCNYDKITEINKVTWIYYSKDKVEEKYEFTMRMYHPERMNRLISDAGLHVTNVWGSHEGTPIQQSSKLQIYECQL